MNPHSVLLIDPDRDSRVIYSMLLDHSGYRVVVTSEMEEGVRVAREERPTLILTELFVRTAHGWTILEALRGDEATAAIPIIALSAHALPDDRRRAWLADVFLSKPCGVNDLLKEVERLCGTRYSAARSA
jgi:CheY-like chemotaxis protein